MLQSLASEADHVFGNRHFATLLINQRGTMEILGMIGGFFLSGLHGWLLQLTTAGLLSVRPPCAGDKQIVVSGYDPLMKADQETC